MKEHGVKGGLTILPNTGSKTLPFATCIIVCIYRPFAELPDQRHSLPPSVKSCINRSSVTKNCLGVHYAHKRSLVSISSRAACWSHSVIFSPTNDLSEQPASRAAHISSAQVPFFLDSLGLHQGHHQMFLFWSPLLEITHKP